ncbi:hypothetical protein CPB84DRAFT_1837807 [Gymnopilus junonius]|uniref:HNH nuclease domain-containing protein n=1 Tax=Gymnopilus junonius TaxID=109634 RepID=A0A9P5TIZ0_GYMJU|nr:hypothetical protein CPB84DRAFT_1837807 [Gymnopilus junonius]
MTSPRIDVYAQLPLNISLEPDVNIDVDPRNWRWIHCLTFPIPSLDSLQFTPRPYKWIRYAIGAVIGAQGFLSTRQELVEAVNYNAALPDASIKLYYHVSNEEKRRMFPLDPHILRTDITSSVHTPRREHFSNQVAERDGGTCVWSGSELCDAVHLLSHSKGNAYISVYTERRSRDNDKRDIISDIDDIRNGLFLTYAAHVVLGRNLAFLVTPNFAMDTADIDPNAPPLEKRYTAHVFKPDPALRFESASLQIKGTYNDPPDILFDAVYASALLHQFADGSPDSFDMLMALPYILIPPDELQKAMKEAEEKIEAAEQQRVQAKVESWLRQVDSGT